EQDDTAVAAAGCEPDSARDEVAGDQMMRHRHAGEAGLRLYHGLGRTDRLVELRPVPVETRERPVSLRAGLRVRRSRHHADEEQDAQDHGAASRKFSVWAMW